MIYCLLVLGMANWKKACIVIFCLMLIASSVFAQRNSISIGPMLSISKNEPGVKDKKGFGASAEYYHRFFSNSGLRVFLGYEEIKRPGDTNAEASYLSFRTGYQHNLAKNRLMLWGDAGVARLQYTFGGQYDLFTFSAGGGYVLPLAGKNYLQFQAFYVYTDGGNIPFSETDFYGWGTFRIAYGLGFGRPVITPSVSKL
jgi:hypothetical protein